MKQKILSLPRNFVVRTFGKLLIVFATKVDPLYLLYSTSYRCCLLHRIKKNRLLKTFLRTIILMSKNKSYESKVKFKQASNHCKRFLKLPNLLILMKQKILSLPRNFVVRTFGKLLIVFATKVDPLYLLYSTSYRCCLLHRIKKNWLLKTFLRTIILMSKVSFACFSF